MRMMHGSSEVMERGQRLQRMGDRPSGWRYVYTHESCTQMSAAFLHLSEENNGLRSLATILTVVREKGTIMI